MTSGATADDRFHGDPRILRRAYASTLTPPAIAAMSFRYEPGPTATMSVSVPVCRPTMISTLRGARPATAERTRSSRRLMSATSRSARSGTPAAEPIARMVVNTRQRSRVDRRCLEPERGELGCRRVRARVDDHQVGLQSRDHLRVRLQERAHLRQLATSAGKRQ